VENEKKNHDNLSIIICIVIFLTNLSMLENVYSIKLFKFLPLFSWLLLLFIMFLKKLIIIPYKLNFIYFIGFTFLFFVLTSQVITQNDYISATLTYPFIISVFMIYISYCASKSIDNNMIIYSYVISTFIVMAIVYFKYYRGIFSWSQTYSVYIYRGQLSQTLFTSIAALYILLKPKSRKFLVLKWIAIMCMIIFLLMLRNRSSLVEIILMIFMIVFMGRSSKRLKYLTIVIVIIGAISILINDTLYKVIIESAFLFNRGQYDLNSISSGRIDILMSFPALFRGHELFGMGNIYFENFILGSILQYGVLGGSPLIIFSLYPIIWAKKNLSMTKDINLFFIVIACAYWSVGLFEGVAPLGPGLKCYFLWFIFGLLLGQSKQKKINYLRNKQLKEVF
jgi:hypothetical protein